MRFAQLLENPAFLLGSCQTACTYFRAGHQVPTGWQEREKAFIQHLKCFVWSVGSGCLFTGGGPYDVMATFTLSTSASWVASEKLDTTISHVLATTPALLTLCSGFTGT